MPVTITKEGSLAADPTALLAHIVTQLTRKVTDTYRHVRIRFERSPGGHATTTRVPNRSVQGSPRLGATAWQTATAQWCSRAPAP